MKKTKNKKKHKVFSGKETVAAIMILYRSTKVKV